MKENLKENTILVGMCLLVTGLFMAATFMAFEYPAIRRIIAFTFIAYLFFPKGMDLKALSKKDYLKMAAIALLYICMIATIVLFIINAQDLAFKLEGTSYTLTILYIIVANTMRS